MREINGAGLTFSRT